VFTAASKTCFTLGVVAVIGGLAYAAATGDRAGFTLLEFLGFLAASLGALWFFALGPDTSRADASDTEVGESRKVDTTDVPRPSIWPLVAAVGVGLLAAGAALDALLGAGVIVGLIATFAWLAQAWREHPSWTQEMTDRLNDRFVVPIGLPGTVIALVGIGVISFSRVLLAVNKDLAALIALLAAIAIMAGCAFVASRERMGRAALTGLSTFAVVTVVAAGIAGAVKGEREFHHAGGEHEGHGKQYRIAADDLEFDLTRMDLPAETDVTLVFENEEEGVPHNWSLYTEKGGKELFIGEIITGVDTIEYEFTAPDSGTFYFQCDVHPAMSGEVAVSREASEPEEESGQATDPASQNRNQRTSTDDH
jgi:plastocyanin